MGAAIRFGLIALFLAPAPAQTQPDIVEILKNISRAYRAASQYELQVDTTTNEKGTRAVTHAHLIFKAPNKYRMEVALPSTVIPDSDFREQVTIDDGSMVWIYLPKVNQYRSFRASELTDDAPGDLGDIRPEAVDNFLMWRYRSATDFADTAKYLREESVEIAGVKVACYVVTVSPEKRKLTYTWWVEKKAYHVVRGDDGGNSAVFTSIKFNEPIPDEVFKFEPPPGARKVETQQ